MENSRVEPFKICSMNFEIIPTPDFERAFKALAKRHRSLKQDILEFINSLQQNPFQGDELSPGIRKIRMAITSKGRGKAGGARIITYTIVTTEKEGCVFLIDIYDKADFSTVDINIINKMILKLGLLPNA